MGGKSWLSGSLRGSPDTKSPFGRTRSRPSRSLARLWLHHGQRTADAYPPSLDVAGSDPPSRQTSIGTGEDGAGQPHPPRRCGVSPSQQSLSGRPNSESSRPGGDRRCRAAHRPAGQPVRRCLVAALDTLPGRISGSGATPGIRGEGVQARSPLCRTEPSARGGRSPPRHEWLLLPRPAVRRSRKTLP